jgi:hypothetical protein
MRTPAPRSPRHPALAGRGTALVPLALLALTLTGCSRHTAVRLQADLVAFLDPTTLAATVPLPAAGATAYLPPDDATGSIDAPNPGAALDLTALGVPADALAALDAFEVHLHLEVTPSVDTGAGEATLYLGPGGSPPPADVFVPANAVASVPLPALAAGIATPVEASFAFDPATDAALFDALAAGPGRLGLGVRLDGSGTAGQAQLRLRGLEVGVRLAPGWGLP